MTNPARQWAVATGGLLARFNEKDPSLLGGSTPSPHAAGDAARVLKKFWDVSDRAALLETLGWLMREGHRKQFAELCALDAAITATARPDGDLDAEIDDEDVIAKIQLTREHRQRVGPRSLLAWDGCRVASVAGWGYLAGMMSEDEAWSFILPMAMLLQQTHSSWDELGKHYQLGREFQSGSWDAPLARAQLALLEEPTSPWRNLPWNVDLRAHGLAIPLQAVFFEPLPAPTHVAKRFDPKAGFDGLLPPAAGPSPSGGTAVKLIVGGLVVLMVAIGAVVSLGLVDIGDFTSTPDDAPTAAPKATAAPKPTSGKPAAAKPGPASKPAKKP